MNPKIKLKGVSKKYTLYHNNVEKLKAMFLPKLREAQRDFYALKDISLEIFEGETIGVVGINGSGKSTISNVLSSVIPPTEGEIEIHGETSLIAINVGLNNNLNGYENIEQKCLMHGFSKDEIIELTPLIEEFADIGDFIDQPVKNYSSGMKSRLGFAISVHTNPDIMIVDEALSVGDKTFYQKCKDKIDEFKAQNKTIIFISHNVGEIKNLSDRVLWLHNGEVRAFGEKEEVIKDYEQYIKWFNKLSKKEKEDHKDELKKKRSLAPENVQADEEEDRPYDPDQAPLRSSRGKKSKGNKQETDKKRVGHAALFFGQLTLYLGVFLVAAYFLAIPSFMEAIGISEPEEEVKVEETVATEEEVESEITMYDEPVPAFVQAVEATLYENNELSESVLTLPFGTSVEIIGETDGGEIVAAIVDGNESFIALDDVVLFSEDEVEQLEWEAVSEGFEPQFSGSIEYFIAFLGANHVETDAGFNQSGTTKSPDELGYTYSSYPYGFSYKVDDTGMIEGILAEFEGSGMEMDQETVYQLNNNYVLFNTEENLAYFFTVE